MTRIHQLAAALGRRGWALDETLSAAQKAALEREVGITSDHLQHLLGQLRERASVKFANGPNAPPVRIVVHAEEAAEPGAPRCVSADCRRPATRTLGSHAYCGLCLYRLRAHVEAMRARFEGQGP